MLLDDADRQSMLDAVGEPFELEGGVQFTGVLDIDGYAAVTPELDTARPRLVARSADVSDVRPGAVMIRQADGSGWAVVDSRPDSAGFTALALERTW